MERSHRVAVGSILTECNQFGGKLIERAEFARSQLARGQDVMSIEGGAVGGMVHTLREQRRRDCAAGCGKRLSRRPDCPGVLRATEKGTSWQI